VKLRIVNETGMSKHTSVFDEHGNDLAKYIKKMVLTFDVNGIITADVTLVNIQVETVAELGLVLTEMDTNV
jgi:hypothetical protein